MDGSGGKECTAGSHGRPTPTARPQLRIWEVGRSGPGGQPTNGVGKAERDVGAPVLDLAWKDDGVNLFAAGCGKVVKQWNLQAEQVQDIGSVRARGGGGSDGAAGAAARSG